jgi:hypothetical protein
MAALEILVLSQRNKDQSAEADRRDGAKPSEKPVDQARPPVTANDNDGDEAWPLIPFPDDWYAG